MILNGNGLNYVSKNFVTCAVIRKLLRKAVRVSRMGDMKSAKNVLEKPVQKWSLEIRKYSIKMERNCHDLKWILIIQDVEWMIFSEWL